jgi:thioredoxin-disulfide reductase
VSKIYDVIIIGAGPAGLAAGMYASRRVLKTLIVSKSLGGQVVANHHVENYPGFSKIPGMKLIQKMEKQVQRLGVKIVFEEVLSVKEHKDMFKVKIPDKEFETKTVIFAFGKTPRSLNVPGEKNFEGRGVSYCATCDGPLYKKKVVAVIGGGNSALDAASYLSKLANKVYLIHRRDEFRGFESSVERLKEKKNVEFVLSCNAVEFKGTDYLHSVVVKNCQTNERREIKVDGAFIEIGSDIETKLIKDLVKLDENNHIIIDNRCQAFYPNNNKVRPGIFAAGDVANTPFKQIVVAAGEGAKAALQAYGYIHGEHPVHAGAVAADWGSEKK